MLAFKNLESIDEWAACEPMLLQVLRYLYLRIWPASVPMVITRIFDPPMPGESGVHRETPYRAADVRTSVLQEVEVIGIVKRLNNAFDYGGAPGKNVALYHTVAGNVPHLHVQVRPGAETKLRPPQGTDV